jgi:hypothetical protein
MWVSPLKTVEAFKIKFRRAHTNRESDDICNFSAHSKRAVHSKRKKKIDIHIPTALELTDAFKNERKREKKGLPQFVSK